LTTCKKNTETLLNEGCILTSLANTSGGFKLYFYYNNKKQLIAKTRAVTGRLSGIVPNLAGLVLDTIVYDNDRVTIYSLDVTDWNDSMNILQHKPLNEHFEKIIGEYINGKVAIINYYNVSRGVDYYKFKKTINYNSNNQVSQIKINGSHEICNGQFVNYLKQIDYTFNYLNSDSCVVLGTIRSDDGALTGVDTLGISFYPLKNPLSRLENLPLFYGNFVFEKMSKIENRHYIINNRDGSNVCLGKFFLSVGGYSDNGKGYPKELGIYGCE
jgi:hypothetical protein